VRNRHGNEVSNEIMERFSKVSAGAQSGQSPRYAYGKVLGWRSRCVGGQCFSSAGWSSEWANEAEAKGNVWSFVEDIWRKPAITPRILSIGDGQRRRGQGKHVRTSSGHGLWEAGIREQFALVSLPRKARFHGSYSFASVVAGSQGAQSLVLGYPTDSLLQRIPFSRR